MSPGSESASSENEPHTASDAERFAFDQADEHDTSNLVESAPPAPSQPFVGKWNRLVSTTNWEKGRIICQWREALSAAGNSATASSDEAWAHLVGGVTAQHVGRLRRVYAKFGDAYEEYPDLYWSHFQVALEWEDAEMWLEGAVQNAWSVSQMRAARWKAHGAPSELKPRDEDIIVAEIDEDALAAPIAAPAATTAAVQQPESPDSDDAEDGPAIADSEAESAAAATVNSAEASVASEAGPAARPFEHLPDLPDDLAKAFDEFKLVILSHKMSGWRDVSRDTVLACLDALKALAALPAEG